MDQITLIRDSEPVDINIEELKENLRYAMYRFFTIENRSPTFIVMSTQLAYAFAGFPGRLLHHCNAITEDSNISSFGFFDGVLIVGQDRQLDPLFQLI